MGRGEDPRCSQQSRMLTITHLGGTPKATVILNCQHLVHAEGDEVTKLHLQSEGTDRLSRPCRQLLLLPLRGAEHTQKDLPHVANQSDSSVIHALHKQRLFGSAGVRCAQPLLATLQSSRSLP